MGSEKLTCVSVESSVSSGESVSCFSSSGHSCSSVIGGDCDHAPSEVKKPFAQKHECNVKPTTNLPGQTRDQPCCKVRPTNSSVLLLFIKIQHCTLNKLFAIFQLGWDLEYCAYLYFHSHFFLYRFKGQAS